MALADPVLSIILNAGSITLRELFARVGSDLGTRLRLANLLLSGEAKLESPEGEKDTMRLLKQFEVEPGKDEETIAAQLELAAHDLAAGDIEIAPTVKTWRNISVR